MKEKDLVIAVDVGSSNCKAALLNKSGQVLKVATKPVSLISPKQGWFEICPHKLWSDIFYLIQTVSCNFKERILTFGISVQRNTFITWNKDTGEYLHNFMTWMDKRAANMCTEWNNSSFMNVFQWAGWVLGSLCGSHRMLCASTFKAKCNTIPMRLKWILMHNKKAHALLKSRKLCFGTLETWLIWKLTKGRTWATEFSCASCTGIFDIWTMSWSSVMSYLFEIPIEIFPEVRSSNAYFGKIDKSLGFGFSVPISGVLGDQQASMFGNLLYCDGNTKLTLGTVISCNVNTGNETHPTSNSIYPVIGWKLNGQDPCFIAEFFASNGGRAVEWTVTSGLVKNLNDIDALARDVPSTEGVTFVPAFNGMEVPQKDAHAETSLFGITLRTKTSHIVRAVLESQAYLSCHVLDNMFQHYKKPLEIVVDGGTSRSSFVLESLSQISQVDLQKSESVDGSLIGAALVAGLGIGLYQSLDDIKSSVNLEFSQIKFNKNSTDTQVLENRQKWYKSVEKCVDWSTILP